MIRTKKVILEQLHQCALDNFEDATEDKIMMEVVLDIRDALILIAERLAKE